MIKRVLVHFVFLIVTLNITAQVEFNPSTYLGISVGANLSRVGFKPIISQDLLTSNSFGIVIRHISEPHIGLQFEINYAGKGWIENRDSIGTYTRKLQVIELPVLAVFVAGTKVLRLVVSLGPYGSYLKSEKETISVSDSGYYRPYYNVPLISKWEFGLMVGVGIEVHTKIGAFGIRASYSNSLTNLFPLNVDEYYCRDSRNQVLNVGATYLIKL
jgi:hypothetical protein